MTKEDFLNCISHMEIQNVKCVANLSIENGVWKATADPNSNSGGIVIGDGREDFCEEGMSAIIVPQTVSGGKDLFYIDFGEKENYYTLPEDITFEAGKVYIFTLTLTEKDVTLSSPEIRDWVEVEKDGTLI